MTITTPKPFKEALQGLKDKAILATDASSRQLAKL
jgi:hypothetical protein